MTNYSIILLIIELIDDILVSIGCMFIFTKCGFKKICAFIPGYREYKLAACADMKEDGAVLFQASIIDVIISIAEQIIGLMGVNIETSVLFMIRACNIMVECIVFFYLIRIYIGLCKTFEKRKKWVFLWVFFKPFIALIWGFNKNFQPSFKAGEIRRGEFDDSQDVSVLEKGLTVNIKARSVGTPLRRRYLLRDIHMNIKPGRMVLLLGGSGAGKTTFINALTGYEKADASILLNGRDIYKEFEHMKYEIGFVPQQDLIRYNDTVSHTLDDAAYLRLQSDIGHKERMNRINEVMDIFGLTPVKDNIVGKQSGGQKKRISIASEFISNPSLYVLDEPDSGLDGILAKDLMKRLNMISRKDKIVIVITHSPDRVLEYFDDVIVLAKDKDHIGRLVFFGPTDEAKKFFGKDTMEDIVKCINRQEEGGDGMADELIEKFGGLCND